MEEWLVPVEMVLDVILVEQQIVSPRLVSAFPAASRALWFSILAVE